MRKSYASYIVNIYDRLHAWFNYTQSSNQSAFHTLTHRRMQILSIDFVICLTRRKKLKKESKLIREFAKNENICATSKKNLKRTDKSRPTLRRIYQMFRKFYGSQSRAMNQKEILHILLTYIRNLPATPAASEGGYCASCSCCLPKFPLLSGACGVLWGVYDTMRFSQKTAKSTINRLS